METNSFNCHTLTLDYVIIIMTKAHVKVKGSNRFERTSVPILYIPVFLVVAHSLLGSELVDVVLAWLSSGRNHID